MLIHVTKQSEIFRRYILSIGTVKSNVKLQTLRQDIFMEL